MIEVSENIYREATLFLIFLGTGCLLVAVYDVLRILRRLIPHGKWILAVEDILYWMGTAIFLFILLCRENEGLLRGFCLGAAVAGMFLYNQTLSPVLVKYISRGIRFVFRLVGKPVKIMGRQMLRPVRYLSKYIIRALHHWKRVGKKTYRTIKMALCKR